MTATPEQLQLMLYDGAIRFSTQAREALGKSDFETSCEKLLRAQRIVLEMRNGLRPEVNASLCERMAALYDFVYNRLVDANMKRDPAAIDEALQILEHQRETWQMLIEKIRREGASPTGAEPEADEPVAASFSVEG